MSNFFDSVKDKATAATAFKNDLEVAVIKACNRKITPPKAKHVRLAILVATNSRSVAMADLFRLISDRLKENNWVIVFKALILVHHLSRESAGDRVLGYLATQPTVLNLQSFKDKTSSPAGVEQAKNIRVYAAYLEEKVFSFRDLKIDYCRDNGDLTSTLRSMSIPAGLFKHVEILNRLVKALINCKYYLDELDNAVTLESFKFLVKDSLKLYHALNEGVIKILDKYFEMTKEDAKKALELYKQFNEVTDKIIDFFKVAKRVESGLSTQIPDIKSPPASLIDSLTEYLQNFESNQKELTRKQSSPPRQALIDFHGIF
ncbi:ANTH-domain-containing protein [Rozella allomycis CSF55]|uniref:ANTH-domain-containing protein n=1 Tax=Rozella allomycis (strain CSF55) TaxID=988480 RepID=A0A075AYB2_ROZAC|nr:Epsin-like domain-containing protein [Rozella allomycis CSF55]RKP18868.1 ANTH-domain-containing protein [Rozella allomycis CSF55]|eukprot:EPZ35267.1 Epsin-like domain-containing protein [Rozella allomycis CSF55]